MEVWNMQAPVTVILRVEGRSHSQATLMSSPLTRDLPLQARLLQVNSQPRANSRPPDNQCSVIERKPIETGGGVYICKCGSGLKSQGSSYHNCLVFSKEVVTFNLCTLEFVSTENLAGKIQSLKSGQLGAEFICRYGHQGGVCCFGLGYKLLRLCTLQCCVSCDRNNHLLLYFYFSYFCEAFGQLQSFFFFLFLFVKQFYFDFLSCNIICKCVTRELDISLQNYVSFLNHFNELPLQMKFMVSLQTGCLILRKYF